MAIYIWVDRGSPAPVLPPENFKNLGGFPRGMRAHGGGPTWQCSRCSRAAGRGAISKKKCVEVQVHTHTAATGELSTSRLDAGLRENCWWSDEQGARAGGLRAWLRVRRRPSAAPSRVAFEWGGWA